jgi:hypothetical protein
MSEPDEGEDNSSSVEPTSAAKVHEDRVSQPPNRVDLLETEAAIQRARFGTTRAEGRAEHNKGGRP